MVYLRNAEWELVDNFRSLTETGKTLVLKYSEEMANHPAIPSYCPGYGEMDSAKNMVVMSQMERTLINNFRKCNDDGRCCNILDCVKSVAKGHRNPDYITTGEWLLLNKYRNATAKGQFEIIRAVYNAESDRIIPTASKTEAKLQSCPSKVTVIDFMQVRGNG